VNTIITKLGATGDVVRTTTLLARLPGHVTWITEAKNVPLLRGFRDDLRCLAWEDRAQCADRDYDLAINLEDTLEVAALIKGLKVRQLYGAYADDQQRMQYTKDASAWFDLSLISVHGRQQADHLKLLNRRTYQDLVFVGLGFQFTNEPYRLPAPPPTDLSGDVAVAREAGPVWPMKNWAYYDQLIEQLRADGLRVNVLPKRPTLLEHLGDVAAHRCVVGGDSLPMHFALGTNVRCVSLFNCTSPWEIHDYGLLTKLISPLLTEYFYKRTFDARATTAITLAEVKAAVLAALPARH
jgi:ADP-heptose:LPS heptosyltransferase